MRHVAHHCVRYELLNRLVHEGRINYGGTKNEPVIYRFVDWVSQRDPDADECHCEMHSSGKINEYENLIDKFVREYDPLTNKDYVEELSTIDCIHAL